MQSLCLLLALSVAAPSPRDIDPTAAAAPTVPTGVTEANVRAPEGTAKPKARVARPAPAKSTSTVSPPTAGPAPAPEPTTAPTTDDAPTSSKAKCFAARGQCFKLSAAGLGLLVGGAAVAGTGAAFLAIPDYADPDEAIYDRSLDPPGAVLLAAGSTLLVTGVIMIVVARVRHNKPRQRATAFRWR